jgi:hypothetical protein
VRRPFLCIFLACVAPLAAQEAVTPLEVRTLARLPAELRESSGLAVSRVHQGVLWTHNDSGDGPYVYAIDGLGALIARVEVVGARNVDWEAISLGPCPPGGDASAPCLYIADTGDNGEHRSEVVIYAIPEPDPDVADARRQMRSAPARTLRLRYAEHPRDAEALVALSDGTLNLISKGRSGPIVRYAIPAGAWAAAEFELADPDTLPIRPEFLAGRWVTDAAVDPAGQRVAVRTYTEIFFFTPGRRWRQDGPTCRIGLIEPQGEGIDFFDEQHLLLTSERARGAPAVLTLVRCP